MKLPDCDMCGEAQTELGAILFSSPDKGDTQWCRKYHVCTLCETNFTPYNPFMGYEPTCKTCDRFEVAKKARQCTAGASWSFSDCWHGTEVEDDQ